MENELSENELRSLFHIIDKQSDISMTDEKGNIVYVNKNFIETSKYSRDELIGQNHRILKSGHQPQEVFENLWKTISGGNIWRGEVKNRSKDGSYYWSDSIIAPILGANGKPERYIAVKLNITDKKQAEQTMSEHLAVLNKAKIAMMNLLDDLTEEKMAVEEKVIQRTKELSVSVNNLDESKKKIETLIESIGDGIMAIDISGAILLWNRTAEMITGWTHEEVLNKNFRNYFKIIQEKDRKDATGFIDNAMKEGKVKFIENSVLLVRKDNTEIAVGDSAAPITGQDGNVQGAIVAFRDTTRERVLSKAKDEFVSIASHQLRTPLTAIKGYTGMLLDEIPGKINDKQREYLDEMKHANDRMIELITALLNASRVDLGVLVIEPRPINLQYIAKEALDELEVSIKDKKIKIKTDFEAGLPIINADPKIIKMIFQNLLSNAVKYTPNEGNISLEVKKDGPSFLITVADSGYGIPEDVKSKIFTKMFRADNARAKDPDGTGLGLYIIKAALEQTGGKIWFDSKENIGSTFYVTIPLAGMKKREGTKSLQ